MVDPDLHLFLDDDELLLRQDMPRLSQVLRKEGGAVYEANGADEGTAVGYAAVNRDAAGGYALWYSPHEDGLTRVATSTDGVAWDRQGFAFAEPRPWVDNLGVTEIGPHVAPWFRDAALIGFAYMRGQGRDGGLRLIRSADGQHFDGFDTPLLPGVGDRSSIMYDPVAEEYSLISRRGRRGIPGMEATDLHFPRVANLWTSSDLLDWRDHGIVMRRDDDDPPDVSIYGMQPFRCGRGFLALVEVYHQAVQRLDTQLAYSSNGVKWRRVAGRMPILPRGGEGAWDAHWTAPSFNVPILRGDRVAVYYCGGGSKHGSKRRHWRSVGLATVGKDRWVSLEGGATEGVAVTTALPLNQPMRLEVNVDCRSGYLGVEMIPAAPGSDTEAGDGEPIQARLEHLDVIDHPVPWPQGDVIGPVTSGKCFLKFTMTQGSLFSFRWAPVCEVGR